MPENASKPALQSVTIWGAVGVLAVNGLRVLGYAVDDATANEVVAWVANVGTVVGVAVTIYGRVKASKTISGVAIVDRYGRPLGVLAVLLLVPLMSAGCAPLAAAVADPDVQLLNASEGFYKAVAPDYAARLKADPLLVPSDRQRRLRTLDSWRASLTSNGRDVPLVATDADLGLQ